MKKKLIILLILSLALIGSVNAAIPSIPTGLTSDTSQSGYVLWSWFANSTGDVTDSFNVSVNSIWYNGSSSTSYNDNVGNGVTSTITVWAYNNTGNLSTEYITGSQKGIMTFSSITDVIEGIIPLFASIIDLVIAIVPLTIIMIIIGGFVLLINKALVKVFKK